MVEEGLRNMAEKKLRKEVTCKKDGRTLIYYTWEADGPGEGQSNRKPDCQADSGAARG